MNNLVTDIVPSWGVKLIGKGSLLCWETNKEELTKAPHKIGNGTVLVSS
ncbi:hypothetical protein ES703_53567 [subsurface metagenome]